MRALNLFLAVLKKSWIGWKRYPFNLVSSFITIYLLFLIVFFGYSHFAAKGPSFGEHLDGIVVGFLLWLFAISAYSSLSWEMMREAEIGTLEQLFMTPLGFDLLTLFKIIVDFILTLFIFILPVLFIMMATTGRWLHLDLISLLPLFIFTLMSVYGIGFLTGGLALVFKQIRSFFQILQFVFVGLIAAPVDKIPALKALPLSLGTELIAKIMIHNLRLWQLNKMDLIFLILNGTFYFLAGFYIFKYFVKIARVRGVLGHY